MIYVPANSQCHVGTSPPLYWTLTQNEDVMTSNKCFKYNHPTKPKGLICADGSIWNHISWTGSDTSDSPVVSIVQALSGGTSSPSISLSPNGQAPSYRYIPYITITGPYPTVLGPAYWGLKKQMGCLCLQAKLERC